MSLEVKKIKREDSVISGPKTIQSLLEKVVNEKGIKARRQLCGEIELLAHKTERELDGAISKILDLERQVKPNFCNKCHRRPLQDVENEFFINRRLEPNLKSGVAKIERKEIMMLLLLGRKYEKDCPFNCGVFPLDLFQRILLLSNICGVIQWRDRSIRQLPRDIQFSIEQDPNIGETKRVKNITLKGSFRLVPQIEPSLSYKNPFVTVDNFVKTDNLKPVLGDEGDYILVRWDDAENLDWWCEFSITPRGATLKGRIPRDTKCLRFTNYKDHDLRWTFGSKVDPTFWADVSIFM